MFLAKAPSRRARCWSAPPLVLLLTLLALAIPATRAFAWQDLDRNRIDDRIDRVNLVGWNAAFVNDDPSQRMRIGVENPAAVIYAVYVAYDHHPTALDASTLLTTGVTMAWPFMSIDYIQSRAT